MSSCQSDLPICSVEGRCVECSDSSQCADKNLVCSIETCGACTSDDECTTGRCLDGGTCAPASSVVYVGPAPCSDAPHASDATSPYCTIKAALPTSGQVVVRLAPNPFSYDPVVLTDVALDVTLLGPGADQAKIGGVVVQNTNVATYVGVRGLAVEGVYCLGSSSKVMLNLRDLVISGSGEAGVRMLGCFLDLERSIVRDNKSGGIVLSYDAIYLLRADLIEHNTGSGLLFRTSTMGTADRLTIAGNWRTGGPGAVAIEAGATGTVAIQNSIIMNNADVTSDGALAEQDLNVDSTVILTNTITGPGAPRGLTCKPAFVDVVGGDYHLDMSTLAAATANDTCVIGLAIDAYPGNDVDDQPVKGPGADIGADEAG